MFLESLIETTRATRARRSLATFLSFCIEVVAVAVLVLLPLIYTEALPGLHVSEQIPPPPAAPAPQGFKGTVTQLAPVPDNLREDGIVRIPLRWPDKAFGPTAPEQAVGAETSAGPCTGCVPGSTGSEGSGAGNRLMTELVGTGSMHPIITPPMEATRKIVVSHMQEGMLINRIEPKYPALALQTRTQGEVLLAAVIGRDGRIENLRVISGHPFLAKAALDAVQQWRYRPTMLNGQPVEVETQIVVNFRLN